MLRRMRFKEWLHGPNVWYDVLFVVWVVVLGGTELAVVCGWWP